MLRFTLHPKEVSDYNKDLPKLNPNPNRTPRWMQDGDTALTLAANKGHLDIVKQLLQHGARVDLQDKVMWGGTTLGVRARG